MTVRAEVLRLHAEGLTNRAIARRVGRSYERVRQLLKEEGLTRNPYCAPSHEAAIVTLYEQGLTDADIAQELGMCEAWAGQVRRRAGVQGRTTPPKLAPVEVERLLTLARQGWRQVDIAAEVGLSQGKVSDIMRRHGIERQPARHRRVKP